MVGPTTPRQRTEKRLAWLREHDGRMLAAIERRQRRIARNDRLVTRGEYLRATANTLLRRHPDRRDLRAALAQPHMGRTAWQRAEHERVVTSSRLRSDYERVARHYLLRRHPVRYLRPRITLTLAAVRQALRHPIAWARCQFARPARRSSRW